MRMRRRLGPKASRALISVARILQELFRATRRRFAGLQAGRLAETYRPRAVFRQPITFWCSRSEDEAATGDAPFGFRGLTHVDVPDAQPVVFQSPACARIRIGVDDEVPDSEPVGGQRRGRVDLRAVKPLY